MLDAILRKALSFGFCRKSLISAESSLIFYYCFHNCFLAHLTGVFNPSVIDESCEGQDRVVNNACECVCVYVCVLVCVLVCARARVCRNMWVSISKTTCKHEAHPPWGECYKVVDDIMMTSHMKLIFFGLHLLTEASEFFFKRKSAPTSQLENTCFSLGATMTSQ